MVEKSSNNGEDYDVATKAVEVMDSFSAEPQLRAVQIAAIIAVSLMDPLDGDSKEREDNLKILDIIWARLSEEQKQDVDNKFTQSNPSGEEAQKFEAFKKSREKTSG